MYYNPSDEIKKIIATLNLQGIAEGDIEDHIDHGELVSRLTDLLADHMHLDEQTKETLHNAAVLHDIGKLQISQNIYGRAKTGLHVSEIRYMRTHPGLGAQMLTQCTYPTQIIDAVLHHHEAYDGSGYPSGIAAERIPYASRLISVCDSFVTLVSDRPYRPAFDVKKAIEMMIDENMQYDMKVFVSFMELTHEKGFEEILQLVDEINKKHGYLNA